MFSFFLVALPPSLLRIPVNMVLRLVSDVGNENEYAMRSDQKSRNRREIDGYTKRRRIQTGNVRHVHIIITSSPPF